MICGQRFGKHVPAATNTQPKIELLSETWSMLSCYKKGTKSVVKIKAVSGLEAVKIHPERVRLKNRHC
jgi:hypothetical protein